MPAKKKGTVKKEVIADPGTLKDGLANYYIGGWSYRRSFADITDISHSVVAAHTAENRTVAPLPRTNVLLLPRPEDGSDEVDQVYGGDAAPEVVEVADKMQIEGVTRKAVRSQQANVKTWETAKPSTTEADTADAAGDGVTKDREGTSVGEEETACAESPVEVPPNPLEDVMTTVGADFAVDDVHVNGAVDIVGVLPQIVVEPTLPTPPKTEGTAAAPQAKATLKASSSTASRRKSEKQKLTPEQQAELEEKRAAEQALFLKQTEEAVALASSQEQYLMSFAHPSRWAHVTIANATFTGPVVVRRAHVLFQNCRFTSAADWHKPQLTVSQYCKVQCVKCTFDAPARCGLYALPAAEVTAKKCLFTGVPHAYLVSHGGEEGRRLGGAAAPAAAVALDGTDDNDDNTANENAATATDPTSSAAADETVLSPDLQRASDEARATRASSVGIQMDSARLSVDECRFAFLGTGVCLHGRDVFGPTSAPHDRGGKRPLANGSRAAANEFIVVQRSHLHFLYNTGILLDAHDVLVRGNTLSDCEHYGLDCRGAACRNVSVQDNTFGHQAVARIREKAQAILMNNQLRSPLINDNATDNPCMEPVY